MKPIYVISMLLWMPAGMTVLLAQPVAPAATKTVLILLRHPEGTLGKRLAELPSSTPVPDEVRSAALHEQASLAQAQQESFDQRLTAAGATQVVHYSELNMVRAEVPLAALSSFESDPAVVSVTPLSEDAPVLASGKAAPLPAASLGVGVPPAGMAPGVKGHRSETFQAPSLSPAIPPAQPSGMAPAFMAAPQPPALPMPNMQPPNMQMPGMPMPGMQMPGVPGTGGVLQSLLGVGGQMGMQAQTAMPRAAGFAMLLSGTAQVAQAILANRKPGCAMTLGTVGAQIPEAGGQGVIAVNAPPTCLWQAHSDAEWLQINTEGPMVGPGIVKYTATAASAGMLRTGVIRMVGIANNKVKGNTSITVRQGE